MSPSELESRALLALGIEIADGATRITALLRTSDGEQRYHTRLAAPPSAEDGVIAINALIERALTQSGAIAEETLRAGEAPRLTIGVAVWGAVDAARGVVLGIRYASGWEDVPLAEQLSRRWHGTTRIESATNAAALAEATRGAGAGHREMLYVLQGRSISSALVLDGRLIRGAHGAAGSLAHWRVRADGPRCSCGASGHLEPLASAQSIVRNMIGRASASEESTAAMLRVTGGRAEAMSAGQVARLAAEGDPAARSVVDAALDGLAAALANLAAVLDPDVIVLGGPLGETGDLFIAPLSERVAQLCETHMRPPQLAAGTLEPFPALVGALVLAED